MYEQDEPRAAADSDLSGLLRNLRRRALLTQEELAQRSGVSVGSIAALENGRVRQPRPGSLRLLADALELGGEARAELVAAARPIAPAVVVGVPNQLPGALGAFVGRVEELKRLDELVGPALTDRATIGTVSGMPGVGKTTLAVVWARRVAHHFPGGQLYLDLRGFDRTGSPMTAHDALWQLLSGLTVMPDQLADGLGALQGRYRSLLDGRRVLILLDNARDADQVRPLLPGGPGCLVLVTSRNHLSGLVAADGACPTQLDVLSESEAGELLVARLGPQRIAAEPTAVENIIDGCARLPLALAILAARAAVHPTFALSGLASAVRDVRSALDVLDGDDPATSARAVFSWSYQTLSVDAARLFRLLGALCGPGFTISAAASLIGVPVSAVRPFLIELTGAHLASESKPGRFAIHDLLRGFAEELAATTEPEPTIRAATRRLLDHYLHSAHSAERLLVHVHLDPITPIAAQPTVTIESFADRDQAMAWFATEHRTLVAAVERAAASGFPVHTWQLAWSLKTYLDWRGYRAEWLHTQQLALLAAVELDDRPAQARVHRVLSFVQVRLGDPEQALAHNQAAMLIFVELNDIAGQGRAHQDVSWQHAQVRQYREAVDHANRAYELFAAVDDRRSMVRALNAACWYLGKLGAYEQALAHGERALELLGNAADHPDHGYTLDSVGHAHHRRGELDVAIAYYERALTSLDAVGDHDVTPEILIRLGEARQAAGQADLAGDAWQRALAVLEGTRDPHAAHVRQRLAALVGTVSRAEAG